jgi:hypothetical protein
VISTSVENVRNVWLNLPIARSSKEAYLIFLKHRVLTKKNRTLGTINLLFLGGKQYVPAKQRRCHQDNETRLSA